MINIILCGANGRMGKAVISAAEASDKFSVCGKIDCVGGNDILSSIDDYTGKADVIIDFSHHSITDAIISYAKKNFIPVIICTTGQNDDELKTIRDASSVIPVFKSGNMSLGINVLTELTRRAAAILDGFDIEIIEKHHRNKLDAPSGTALMLADSARNGRDMKYTYERQSKREKRADNEIGISSVRGGTIVGEHEVIFAGENEVLTLSHSAQSREIFANGALKAAEFIVGKDPGFYDMSDVVNELI